MKNLFVFALLCVSFTASAKNFFEFRKPHERCGDTFTENFSNYKEFLPLCTTASDEAVDCIESVVRTGAISKGDAKACLYINNELAAKAVEYLTKNYRVDYKFIVTLSFIDNEAESDCVQRMLGSGSVTLTQLGTCLREPKNVIEDREFEILGIERPTPKKFLKELADGIKDWWNGK